MGSGIGVFAVVSVEATIHEVEFGADPVLLSFEYRERDRIGLVGLH